MDRIRVHPEFRLNGRSYTIGELRTHAYSLVKEGEPHEISIGAFILDWLGKDITITVKTSGSTGTPKPIKINKEYMVHSARATGHFFGLNAGDTALHCLPTDFIAGKMMLVRAMILGLRLSCVAPTSTPLVSNKKRYDFAAMVPLQLYHTIRYLECIDTLIVGGAPVSFDLKKQLREKTTKIYETYGMTETVTHIAVKQLNCANDDNSDNKAEVFKTVADVSVFTDKRGCLVIEAPKVTDGPVVTNDLVDLISEHEFRWLGRYDNIVNSGGVKLVPEEIEAKLEAFIPQRFFLAGLPDAVLGQKLVLVLEGDLETTAVRKLIHKAKGLSKYQIPKSIYVVPQFLETETGKVHRIKTLALITK